ncbi:MAG TPA: NAD(P)/FAD-dependent oxidoreductase [Candidatus Limnocylindrales bacterium]|nr:NAD(P)/FAD-dependent oxidoreductase [Candidatus Limnocylindrales bacterium]
MDVDREPGLHRVVIIGGGFAGLTAAVALADAPVRVTLVDRRNFHLFTPLLYQVAVGTLAAADICPPLRRVLHRQANAEVLLGEARDLDAERRLVVMTDGTRIEYDTLVLAAGARPNFFGHEEWEGWAPALKTIEDATDIRRRVLLALEAAEREVDAAERRAWMTIAVVGGGPTGVELAGALADVTRRSLRGHFRRIRASDVRIVLLHSGDALLSHFSPGLQRLTRRELERRGVEVRFGSRVIGVDSDGVNIRASDGESRLAARTVLWTAGVRASQVGKAGARSLGAEIDRAGRVAVEPDLTVRGHPEVLVIGDLAHLADRNGDAMPQLAAVATQQGRHAAEVIRARLEDRLPMPFSYRSRGNMATIGRGDAITEVGPLRFAGFPAWVAWLAVHLAYLVGFENRSVVLLRWLVAFVAHRQPSLVLTGQSLPPEVPQPRAEEGTRWVEEETGGAQPVGSRAGDTPVALERD